MCFSTKTFLSASERAGDPAAACMKAMRLSVQGLMEVLCDAAGALAMFAMRTTRQRFEGAAAGGKAGAVAGMLMHHRPQEGSLIPMR